MASPRMLLKSQCERCSIAASAAHTIETHLIKPAFSIQLTPLWYYT